MTENELIDTLKASGLSHEELSDILWSETCYPFSFDEPFPTQLKEAIARHKAKAPTPSGKE